MTTIAKTMVPRTESAYTRLRSAHSASTKNALALTLTPGGQLQFAEAQGYQGEFYLRPTSVGLASSQIFTVKNTSRLPIRFQCSLPDDSYGVLSITPLTGFLRGNQTVQLTIAFAPQIAMEYR